MIERRRRRQSHVTIHLTGVLGLLIVGTTGVAVYRYSAYLTAVIAASVLLMAASHVLLARAIGRKIHSMLTRFRTGR